MLAVTVTSVDRGVIEPNGDGHRIMVAGAGVEVDRRYRRNTVRR